MNQIIKTLTNFGLTDKEISIYLECLKHEEISPYELSKLTNIPRTTVYDVITDLSLIGLIELNQSDGLSKQQTKIKAKNPSTFRKILQQKQKALESLEFDFMNILPDLKQNFHQNNTDGNFQFYPGIEGAKKIYLLDATDDIDLPSYSFDYLIEVDTLGLEKQNEIIDKRTKIRINQKNKRKIILPKNDWSRTCIDFQQSRNNHYLEANEYRWIDNPEFSINQTIIIKNNVIRIISVKENEIWGAMINSPLLAKTFISIFNIIWPLTKQI